MHITVVLFNCSEVRNGTKRVQNNNNVTKTAPAFVTIHTQSIFSPLKGIMALQTHEKPLVMVDGGRG
jgi:hypothetical protein